MKNLLIVILFMVVLTASALFFAQNDAQVEIHYFAGSALLQMNWVLVSVFLLGILVGVSSLMVNLITTKLKLANAKKNLAMKEKEVRNLRELPLKNEY